MPSGMQSLDLGQPSINEGQSLEEQVRMLLNFNLELMQSLRYILSNLGQENFNAKELEDMTAPVLRQIENFEGDLLEVALEAGRASMTASDAFGKAQQLEFTVDGLTIRNPDGSTTIDGNKIKSGTLEGVTLISKNAMSEGIKLEDGSMKFYDNIEAFIWDGSIGVEQGQFLIKNMSSYVPLRIFGVGNAAIDAQAGFTLYLGSTYGAGDIKIGRSGAKVTIEGDLVINGVPFVPAGG